MAPAKNVGLGAIEQAVEHPATILAIGTAHPPTCFYQNEYPDFYFRVTKSDHMTTLKDKFKRICQNTMIEKRYLYLTEEIIEQHPDLYLKGASSLSTRCEIFTPEVTKLGHQAALKAIEEWGPPPSEITHLIVSTTTAVDVPGSDFHLVKLLNLPLTIQRLMLYNQGCCGGSTSLRLAKDIVENSPSARVLIVVSEIFDVLFQGPSETRIDQLVGRAIFADGAAALVVGADPDPMVERPLFQIMSAMQMTMEESGSIVGIVVRETGPDLILSKETAGLVGRKTKEAMGCVTGWTGIEDPNSLFYAVHPGGKAILKEVEEMVGLEEGKLRATWQVLRDYGNVGGATVLFVLDQLRKTSAEEGKATTGEGLEWGVLFGFSPAGIIDTILLRSFSLCCDA